MKRILLFAVMLALNLSCRSSEKGEASQAMDKVEVSSPPSEKQSMAENPICASRPTQVVCCEALTPTCNQCREESQAQQAAWEDACLTDTDKRARCANPPIISECCTEYNEACESCRKDAATTLVAWKAECGTYEAHSCDQQPPTSMCCQAMIPSCQQCKDRNRRIRQEWEDRCMRDSATKEK